MLEGSVRKAGNRIRITAQLLDATNGAHLWADNFHGTLEDVFELQDNVASSVAGVIEPTLQAAEHGRSTQRPTTDLTAYDLYLQAIAYSQSWEREWTIRALDLLVQALKRDAAAMLLLSLQEYPNWAPCLRFLCSCYAHLGRLGDAQSTVEKLRHVTPVLVPTSAEQWRIREDRKFYLDGLRLAVGVAPEEPQAIEVGFQGAAASCTGPRSA